MAVTIPAQQVTQSLLAVAGKSNLVRVEHQSPGRNLSQETLGIGGSLDLALLLFLPKGCSTAALFLDCVLLTFRHISRLRYLSQHGWGRRSKIIAVLQVRLILFRPLVQFRGSSKITSAHRQFILWLHIFINQVQCLLRRKISTTPYEYRLLSNNFKMACFYVESVFGFLHQGHTDSQKERTVSKSVLKSSKHAQEHFRLRYHSGASP